MSSYGRIRDVCGNPIPYGNPYATVIMTTVAYYVAYYVAYHAGTVEVIPGGGGNGGCLVWLSIYDVTFSGEGERSHILTMSFMDLR